MRYQILTIGLIISAISLNGCYVEKVLPERDLDIGEEEKLVSYQDIKGNVILIPPAGTHYEGSSISNDTLTIGLRTKHSSKKEWISFNHKVPTSNILSIKILPRQSKLRHGYIGLGGGNGFLLSGGFAFTNNNFGGNIRLSGLWYAADYLPEDYTGVFNHNNIYSLSVMARIGMFSDDRKVWFGAELGPGIMNCRKESETPNPNYGGSFLDGVNKYIRDNKIKNTIGLSMRGALDFILSDHLGIELAFFGNVNDFRNILGFEIVFLFGSSSNLQIE